MSFTITIENIPDRDLGPVIARMNLPKSVHYELVHKVDEAGETKKAASRTGKKKGARVNVKSKLSMTGRVSTKPDGLLARGMGYFEKCEVESGIGNVSVEDFRAYLVEQGEERSLQWRLLHEGYLKYLDDAA